MDKPISIVVEETKKTLFDIINNSKLQPFVVEPIIQELLNEVKFAKQRQYEIDMERYQKSLKSDDDNAID